ncbi:MAG TPA: PadR family transcriptional regulator [Bacteroidales bacterium]|jgi:PadR family transcriptional regulator PadR|nr:PadR family transcriptional regulator [Bacteroidales bacterium]HPB89097.1 PadR family transcriptional regulator [Bacteroidales bacterium]HPH53283.1 PadR family transcriptional regulator [Bacteroidales bacterium]HPY22201.1 PadR family transcriptional regulator [Bacteroidales bacterium]HQA93671.1 PadR family transcriptional regulator [Bacteroidales bacterium]
MEHIVDNIKSQMRKGLLEYCILLILNKKEAYASSIIEELKQANMIVVEGTLYPLLIRQKNQGLLNYRWEESTQGPPRKYYMITDKGRSLISEMDLAWQEIVSTIETIRK